MRTDNVTQFGLRQSTLFSSKRTSWQRIRFAMSCLLLGLTTLHVAGCSCFKEPLTADEEEALKRREQLAREKKKAKPPFEPMKVKSLPSDDEDARVVVKPGHWTSFRYELKANNEDVKGELELTCENSDGDRIRLERSPFTTSSTRPIVLPKSQTREIEAVQYVSGITNAAGNAKRQVRLRAIVKSFGRQLDQDLMPTVRLRPEQYHFVVLSKTPDRHGHLKLRSAIKPPHDEWIMDGIDTLYYVDYPDVMGELPLPTHPLTWTAIAYVLWDDVEPGVLDSSQQTAMLDWLHWGGQLIVSGPNTLDILRGSFLDPYLPASAGESMAMAEDVAQRLNEFWCPMGTPDNYRRLPVREDRPLNLIELELKAGGRFVPGTESIIADRRVGRGRVVLTAFSLSDREILDWGAFDTLLHGGLMGKPGREFVRGNQNGMPDVKYPHYKQSESLIASGLRYFSRDATGIWDTITNPVDRRSDTGSRVKEVVADASENPWSLDNAASRYGGFRPDATYGIGGWTDFSAMANAARSSLQSAAGIDVPSRQFVLKVLGLYLLCLVPLNWIVFRIIGRVEWAWFVAPLIAIAGAIGVVRSAQLDIGFARSRTEIGVLEIQADYPRGHMTRFTGLYSSLTTNYEAVQDDRSALFLPFSTNPSFDELRLASPRDAVYAEPERNKVTLNGFQVLSNSTGMLRSESYMDLNSTPKLLPGKSLDDLSIENQMGFPWFHAIVLARTPRGIRVAVLDEVDDGTTRRLKFGDVDDGKEIVEQLNGHPVTASRTPEGELSLNRMYKIASNVASLQEGEYRMIAWTDADLSGMQINPISNQTKKLTLIVSHLKYAPAPPPEPDTNQRSDIPDPDIDL